MLGKGGTKTYTTVAIVQDGLSREREALRGPKSGFGNVLVGQLWKLWSLKSELKFWEAGNKPGKKRVREGVLFDGIFPGGQQRPPLVMPGSRIQDLGAL